jgi:sucrose-6-phosphate hydrolase SacC (GH32 family)
LLYDAHSNKLFCGERAAPLKVPGGKLHLRVLLDRAALEIFAAHGLVYLPLGVIPDDDERACFIQARGGASKAQAITVFKLRSSWERR